MIKLDFFKINNYKSLILCMVCSALVFVLLGINFFSVYQLVPILTFYIFQRTTFHDIHGLYLKLCHLLSIIAFLVYPLSMQIGWYFDINKMASASSTSGLLFVYLPIYSTILGLIPSLAAIVIKRLQA
ncbi:hypothetical protein ABIB40_003126 [Pedobacter sp. UYP30]